MRFDWLRTVLENASVCPFPEADSFPFFVLPTESDHHPHHHPSFIIHSCSEKRSKTYCVLCVCTTSPTDYEYSLSLSSNMSQETFEVQLAIYDLSRGMARNLSAQFLGPQFAIDAIPHTGIVVYGREYFFGAGIQSESPHEFRQNTGMFPLDTQSLGRTTVTRSQFEQWCSEAMRNGSYSATSYDLLTRNCNNFSHDAALQGLRLSRGVPQWVLDVPRRFLSSPMGQMVRPMLENMQLTNVSGAIPVAPFSDAASTVTASSPPAVPVTENPWANTPSQSTSSAATEAVPKTTPMLDSFMKPLLSNDTKTVNLCVKKILPMAEDDERDALQQTDRILSHNEALSQELADRTCAVILRCLEKSSNVTFALVLLRIVVLKAPNSSKACVQWLQSAFADRDSAVLKSPAARSTGWLVASNTVSTPLLLTESLETFVEAAVGDISVDSQPRAEVRQAACAMLYNVALVEGPTEKFAGDGLPDLIVSMLCASLERILEEPDTTAKLRRLMVAARIIKPVGEEINAAAKNLVLDLGFCEVLKQVKSERDQIAGAGDCEKLAGELINMLEE